jgi:hypothetical protein
MKCVAFQVDACHLCFAHTVRREGSIRSPYPYPLSLAKEVRGHWPNWDTISDTEHPPDYLPCLVSTYRAARVVWPIAALRMKKPVIEVLRRLPWVDRRVTNLSKNLLP